MKVVQITGYGGPEVLELKSLPVPDPTSEQVLVQAHAIGVGMPDVLTRTGRYPWAPPLPTILGIEMSGKVVALGHNVESLRLGDPVLISARELPMRGGCYAEFICVDASAVYLLPDSIDLDEAACLSNYQVAWHLLNTGVNGTNYESVLVWAAAGGVGTALTQLAKLESKTVIGIASSKEKCEFVVQQGAYACIDRKREDIAQRVHELTSGCGVDLILDCVGGESFAQNIRYLAPLGLAINYGLLQGLPDPSFLKEFYTRLGDSLSVRLFSMHLLDQAREKRREGMASAIKLLEQKLIKPRIYQSFHLDEAKRAHKLLDDGHVLGKLILKP